MRTHYHHSDIVKDIKRIRQMRVWLSMPSTKPSAYFVGRYAGHVAEEYSEWLLATDSVDVLDALVDLSIVAVGNTLDLGYYDVLIEGANTTDTSTVAHINSMGVSASCIVLMSTLMLPGGTRADLPGAACQVLYSCANEALSDLGMTAEQWHIAIDRVCLANEQKTLGGSKGLAKPAGWQAPELDDLV